MHLVEACVGCYNETQSKYFDSKDKPINFDLGNLVLLSIVNLRMKTTNKLKRRFVGPFRIVERTGSQSYRLELPTHWKIHDVFYISLLKFWKHRDFVQVVA